MALKRMIILSMVVHYSSMMGWGDNVQYKYAALNNAYRGIQKVMATPTHKVASQAGTEEDVAKEFEEEFTDEIDEDPIASERRKIQRSMALIRKVYAAQNVSGLSLEVNDFVETVSLDFKNKIASLEAEKNGLWGAKVGWGTLTFISVGGTCFLASRLKGKEQAAIGGVGGMITIGSGAKFYSTLGKEEKLKKHIAQMKAMESSWKKSFKMK